MKYLIIYAAAINIFTLILMGLDKSRARAKGRSRRIPEKHLFLGAALGGALGGIVAMRVWRHKTKHTAFIIGFPLLLVVNIVCVYCLLQV